MICNKVWRPILHICAIVTLKGEHVIYAPLATWKVTANINVSKTIAQSNNLCNKQEKEKRRQNSHLHVAHLCVKQIPGNVLISLHIL